MWPCSKQPACNRLTKAEVRMLFDLVGIWCIGPRPVVNFFLAWPRKFAMAMWPRSKQPACNGPERYFFFRKPRMGGFEAKNTQKIGRHYVRWARPRPGALLGPMGAGQARGGAEAHTAHHIGS